MRRIFALLVWPLLLLVRCEPVYPATITPVPIGAVRINSDTTGTNTRSSAITVLAQTNLYGGTLNATNSVNVGRAGEAGVLTLLSTNGTYTLTIKYDTDGALLIQPTSPDAFDIPALRVKPGTALTMGNIQDWQDGNGVLRMSLEIEGTLFTRRLFAINDGIPNGDMWTRIQSGDITIHPDLGTNTILLDANDHSITMWQSGVTNFYVAASSGWTQTGTNFFGDDGKVHDSFGGLTVTNLTVTSNFVFNTTIITNISQDSIWLSGETTNVLARLNGPFGTNLAQFTFNGGLAIGTNTLPMQGTSKFYILQSYRDVSLGDPGQTLIELDQINSGSGDILQWLINMNGANLAFSRGAANGSDTSSIEESITSTQAKMSFNNGIIVWGPGTTNVIYRSGADLLYTNSGTSPLFYVINTNGSSMAIGLNSSVGRLVASSGSIYSDGKFGANTAGPRTSMDILGSLAYQGDEISLTGDDTTITTASTSATQKWLNSDNNTPANRTIHFSSSGVRGQVMDLIVTANAAQVLNADTVGAGAIKLSADWNGTTYSSLSLRSDGTNWIETARSVK